MEEKQAGAPQAVNWIGIWAEAQKSIQSAWQGMVAHTNAALLGSGPATDKGGVDGMLSEWRQIYSRTLSNLSGFGGEATSRGVVERLMGSIDLYMKLVASWVEMAMKMAGRPDSEKGAAFSELWTSTQRNLCNDILHMTVLSPGLSPLAMGGNFLDTYRAAMGQFMNPMQTLNPGFSFGNPGAGLPQALTGDFYHSWTKAYEDTIGKIARIPPVGPTRESAEKLT
ncbi:MAG: poly(R)-hydroxyalkanoic acid synthase subunit PhaE, partial [Planctomycetota bacterium]|nr:poly(R)-hydroxyalkanoic acid synthase subunit PhaE [Planctomycetota bacterium]